MSEAQWHATTILAVRKGKKLVVIGDGQVSIGQTVMKANARKVRRMGEKQQIIAGFAGAVLQKLGLVPQQIDEMYQLMAIANYEDRFVIPTTHRELVEDAYDLRGGCGFTDGNGCSGGHSGQSLFGGKKFRSPQEFIA